VGTRRPLREVEAYGPAPRQVGEWFLPPGDRLPLVVLVHGGFWRPAYDRHLMDPLAGLLAAGGVAVWNLEYAAADAPWPRTLQDAAAGLDHVAESPATARLALDRVAVVGHSAGGHLALWLASRAALPAADVGAEPRVRPALCVAQAPVADLVTAAREGVGNGAVEALMDGGPDDVPGRYRAGSPQALLPVPGVRVTLVHGDADEDVPVSQSTGYAEAAHAAGMDVRLEVLRGVGHYEHLEVGSPAVAALLRALQDL